MKVATLIAVAFILCTTIPDPIQAKKKSCKGKDGNSYEVGKGYDDNEGETCIHYVCTKKKNKFVMKKKGKCAPVVDGEWSSWSSWSVCSATCGSATKNRKRTCSIPAPSNGEKPCSGPDEEIEECFNPSCVPEPDLAANVTALEASIKFLNSSIESMESKFEVLQSSVESILEILTAVESTSNNLGTCMRDLSSSDCPDSTPGKTGVLDAISSNAAGLVSNKASITSNTAGVASNKADINQLGESVCETISGNKVGVACKFPFTHYVTGITYDACTNERSDGSDLYWCATKTNSEGAHVHGNWGNCNGFCPRV